MCTSNGSVQIQFTNGEISVKVVPDAGMRPSATWRVDVAAPQNLPWVLGQVINVERRARGMSQKTLAKLSGLHPMALSKIERGVHRDVGVVTFARLALALLLAVDKKED